MLYRQKYLLDSHTDISLHGRGEWKAALTNWGSNKSTALETVTNMTLHYNTNSTNPVATNATHITVKEVMPDITDETRGGVS